MNLVPLVMSHAYFPEPIAIVEREPAMCPASVGEVEPLLDLQLRVARRADWLARYGTLARAADRALWLRAEQEVFEVIERAATWRARAAPGWRG